MGCSNSVKPGKLLMRKTVIFSMYWHTLPLLNLTRSERVESRQIEIFAKYDDPKLQAFLEFVMGQYINEGVGELDGSKLTDLIQLRYGAIHDGVKERRSPEDQKFLYWFSEVSL